MNHYQYPEWCTGCAAFFSFIALVFGCFIGNVYFEFGSTGAYLCGFAGLLISIFIEVAIVKAIDSKRNKEQK